MVILFVITVWIMCIIAIAWLADAEHPRLLSLSPSFVPPGYVMNSSDSEDQLTRHAPFQGEQV
jgi:hypothetical protein